MQMPKQAKNLGRIFQNQITINYIICKVIRTLTLLCRISDILQIAGYPRISEHGCRKQRDSATEGEKNLQQELILSQPQPLGPSLQYCIEIFHSTEPELSSDRFPGSTVNALQQGCKVEQLKTVIRLQTEIRHMNTKTDWTMVTGRFTILPLQSVS